jgi:CHAT domain-containing protein/Tfp pilus assembly protein PilF
MLTNLLLVVALLFPSDVAASEDHEISGKQTDTLELTLAAGQAADVVVDQKGIDVIVRILDADGRKLLEVDNDQRLAGQERTTVVADAASTLQVTITPVYRRAAAGHYSVRIAGLRAATERDRAFFEAATLLTKALDLNASGKAEDARATLAKALEIAQQGLGADDALVGLIFWKLGAIERVVARPSVAREKYQRALEIYEKTIGRESVAGAFILDGIGLTYVYDEDYATAEKYLQEARTIMERVAGAEHPLMIGRYQNLAIVANELGDKQTAISRLERALRISEKTVDSDDFSRAAIENNLGAAYREMGDFDKAEPLLLRALHACEVKFGPEHYNVAVPLQELGIIARERKEYAKSLELLWRAEMAREKALGARNSKTVATLIVIANTYHAEGEIERALDLHLRILDILGDTVGQYSNLMLIGLANIAREYAELHNKPCAIEYQTRMDEVLEKNLELNLAIGSERQKLAYADTSAAGRTDRTISLHAIEAPDDRPAAEHALLVLLQRKGRVLDAMSDNFATLREGLSPDDRTLLDKLRSTTAELAKVALNGPGKTPLADYRAQLRKLEDEKEKLEHQIGARSAAFRAEHRPVTVAAVRDAIPSRAALVEFAVYRPFNPRAATDADQFADPRYIAYVLRRHGNVAWKDLGSAKAVDDAIAQWRKELRDSDTQDVDRLARTVDRMVMQPVRKLTGNATQLLIAPDGQLGLIPFEALVEPGGRYLVERYSINYLSSGRDLLRMEVSHPSRTPPVVIADPLFGESSVALPMTSARLQRRSITSGDDFSAVYFGPLAGTREEARSISELFPDARVLTGKDASKKAIQHLDAPRMLHVATHGFFLGTATTPNPLLRSGLALSGANLSSRGNDDGVLTALEASTLNLWGTKLVTLSACDSGVGQVKNREGVYGLRRAFFLAGAETVVMSLWPVSDYVTRQMMTSYYSGLKRGLGRGEALRQAQLSMLQRKDRRHPFYWASFIQSGEWTGLDH